MGGEPCLQKSKERRPANLLVRHGSPVVGKDPLLWRQPGDVDAEIDRPLAVRLGVPCESVCDRRVVLLFRADDRFERLIVDGCLRHARVPLILDGQQEADRLVHRAFEASFAVLVPDPGCSCPQGVVLALTLYVAAVLDIVKFGDAAQKGEA